MARRKPVNFDRRKASVTEIMDLRSQVRGWVNRVKQSVKPRGWDTDDLVQEVLLKAMVKLEKFEGRSSLKTWVFSLARNHIIQLARYESRRPNTIPGADLTGVPQMSQPRRDLRESVKELLSWLRSNPERVNYGWETLNMLLKNQDFEHVAFSLTMHTGEAWTTRRVVKTVRKIQDTKPGKALCQALGS